VDNRLDQIAERVNCAPRFSLDSASLAHAHQHRILYAVKLRTEGDRSGRRDSCRIPRRHARPDPRRRRQLHRHRRRRATLAQTPDGRRVPGVGGHPPEATL